MPNGGAPAAKMFRTAEPTRAPALETSSVDWDLLLTQAARHRVRPLLHANLASANIANLPDTIRAQLTDFAASNTRRNLFLTGEMFRLLDLLQSRGIPAAPFKGPTLAALAYGNIAMREAGDLDLLVRRRDIVRAKRLLTAHGFEPVFPTVTDTEAAYLRSLTGKRETRYLNSHCEHHLLRPAAGVNVDLHWALALREFWLPLKENELWDWLAPQDIAGRSVLTFAPEELLIVLCINGAKDCWERLDRICDVVQLLRSYPDLNWGRVFDCAARCGALRMVCLGLQLAADVLGAELPPLAHDQVIADRKVVQLSRQVQTQLFAKRAGEVEAAAAGKSIFHLAMRERLHDGIGYCLAHLEPTVGDWAALPLPDGLRFMHYLFRPLRLAWRLCRK